MPSRLLHPKSLMASMMPNLWSSLRPQLPWALGAIWHRWWLSLPWDSSLLTCRDMWHLLAAAAAESLQSCPTLRDPIDDSPAGSSLPFFDWFFFISSISNCSSASGLSLGMCIYSPRGYLPQVFDWHMTIRPRQHIKKQRRYFANKDPSNQSYGFPSSHVWMWELDCKESWALKNGCFWTVVLEKTFESPLDCKEIQPVHPKGNWSWLFTGRTDAEAETPILWPSDVKNWLTWKDPDAGKDWRQEEKGMTEDEMAGWHHRLSGQEFE